MKKISIFLLVCFISLLTVLLYTQDNLLQIEELLPRENQNTGGETSVDAVSDQEDLAANREIITPERQRIEMEIKTSTLVELAAWSRSLGLSEGGTRAELSNRLRDYFELPEPGDQNDSSRRLITIESAQTTEYFTIDVIDEDYARLRGGVRLSLRDDETIHRISANEILFNRTRNIITARGRVIYEKIDGEKTETFRGENITVNIDNWSSIFLDGNTTHEIDSDGTAYLFSGKVISRSEEDVTILNNARITNAANEEAFWSITASKLWFLPGSDFAILNAVLKVGEIPVLYIPFFLYSADDVIFHPVIGYRSREGGFIQTTTYILGQPRASDTDINSISRILGSSDDMEKERQGMFLRSTGRKRVDTNTISLRALIDYYVNLGTYLGLELNVPKTGNLNPLEFSLGVGFTRTVTMDNGNYTPYAPDYDGSFDWNHSNLLSMPVPFRYRMILNSSISAKYGTLSWDFPFRSDPFVDRDFLNRTESMDWMNMIKQGIVDDSLSNDDRGSYQYQWDVNGTLNPSFPALAPFISRISVSNISTTFTFITVEDNVISTNNIYSPERFFYAPDKFKIYSFSGSVAGTPLTIGGASQSSANNTAAMRIDDPLGGIGRPISPWAEDSDQVISEGSSSVSSRNRNIQEEILVPPALAQRFDLPGAGNNKFSIDYQLSPTSSTELQFMSGSWKAYDQVDWGDVQSILTSVGGRGDINFRMDHTGGLYSNTVTFSGDGTWVDYTYINEEADIFRDNITGLIDESKIEAARRQQYGQTNYSTSYKYDGTVRPLYENPIFGQSNLNYTFRGTLVRSRRYANGNGPELTPEWGSWVKEKLSENIPGLNIHRLSANLAANIIDNQQTISISADLPPLDGLIRTSAVFRFWISETRANFRMEKPEGTNEWIHKPFDLTEILKFENIGAFTYNMIVNPEQNNEITNIRSALTLWDLRAEFSAVRTAKSFFETDPTLGGRWEKQGEESLRPNKLAFYYAHEFSGIEIIRNRMIFSLDLNSSLTFDLQEHTNSNFQLSFGFLINIPGFLELKLAAISENAVIWRYFKNVPGMENLTRMYADGPQNNVFTDLLDSFNFSDEAKRRRSGFKMKGLNLTTTHFLGDWRAELSIKTYPYQSTSSSPWEITSDVTFLVQWKPISEIKSEIQYEQRYDRWTLQ
jgi:hypothetical protein